MTIVDPKNFVTDILTFSYAHVFEAHLNPSGAMKFSACLLLDKDNVAEKKRWDAAIEQAIKNGIALGKFTANQRPILKLPIRDGDTELETGIKKGLEYKGRYFINANSDNKPGVTKPANGVAVPISDPLEFYSGCKGRAVITFYPYGGKTAGGSRGIAVGLNAVYKTGEGDRLDGRVDATSVFAEYAETDGDLGSSTVEKTGDDPAFE